MAVSPAPPQGLPLLRVGGLVVSVALVGVLAEDDIVMGWLIPGIMFELMALPALFLWSGSSWLREHVTERPISGGLRWKLGYVALIAVGAWIGLLSFNAWT